MTSGKKYRPQLQRVGKKEQKPFVPTDRDVDILKLIELMGWLNTEHIIKVFFPPRPITEKEWLAGKEQEYYQLKSSLAIARLAGLFHRGDVERIKPYSKHGISIEPIAYYLKGAKINLDTQHYWHAKKVRDIVTDIYRACKIHGVRIIESKTAQMLNADYEKYHADHFFLLFFNNRLLNLFIEVDRAEEGHFIWGNKVKGSIDFLNSDEYRRIYREGHKEIAERLGATHEGVRIATITTGDLRLANMMETTKQAGGRMRYWFSTFEKCNPKTILSEEIWNITTREEKLHKLTE